MPTRVVIHSSLVSTIFDSISLSRMSDGAYEAMPAILAYSMILCRYLDCSCLLDYDTAAVETTFAAYGVVDVPCAAVGAYSQSGHLCLVVSSALCCPGLGLFSFRMCHFFLLFCFVLNLLLSISSVLRPSVSCRLPPTVSGRPTWGRWMLAADCRYRLFHR